MKFCFKDKGRKICLEVNKCEGVRQGLGLMFKSRHTKPLLFDFGKDSRLAITSLFVFFPFVAVWLDEKNNVLEKKIVNPFTFAVNPKKHFRRLVEIPVNAKYRREIKLLFEAPLGIK